MENNKDEGQEIDSMNKKIESIEAEEDANSLKSYPVKDDGFKGARNVFSDVKPIGAVEEKKVDEDYDPEDYLDKSAFKRMGIGLWLSENRKNITKIIAIILIIISAVFFIYSVYNLIIYFQSEDPTQGLLEDNIRQNPSQIIPLTVSGVYSFRNNLESDLVVSIINENPRFTASFQYCFKRGDTEVSCGTDFILPSEEKYVIDFKTDALLGEGAYQFDLVSVSWNRIAREIIDYNYFYNERLNFVVSDLNFSPSSARISANIDLNSLDFNIENRTAYSYYEVPLNILIFSGNSLAGVNRNVINNFITGESRSINLSWSADLRSANRVVVLPSINLFDQNVYLRYRGN